MKYIYLRSATNYNQILNNVSFEICENSVKMTITAKYIMTDKIKEGFARLSPLIVNENDEESTIDLDRINNNK